MPTPVNTFYNICLPRFSINPEGTLITAKFPVVTSQWSQSSVVRFTTAGGIPGLQQGDSSWMASRYAVNKPDSWYLQSGLFLCDLSGGETIDDAYYPAWDTVQFGYVLYPAASAQGRPTTGYTQFAEVPLKKKYSLATFSATTISATFATPVESSRLAVAVRFPGGTGTVSGFSPTLVPDTWRSVDFSLDPDPLSWYSPGVSIRSSGGASVGNTSRVTITAPDSLRTLTSGDFTVSGGTLSNFTRVS
jgi:hypothetical protein